MRPAICYSQRRAEDCIYRDLSLIVPIEACGERRITAGARWTMRMRGTDGWFRFGCEREYEQGTLTPYPLPLAQEREKIRSVLWVGCVYWPHILPCRFKAFLGLLKNFARGRRTKFRSAEDSHGSALF